MAKFTRRRLLQSSMLGAATFNVLPLAGSLNEIMPVRKGRIRQSVSRWCYGKVPLEQLAEYSAKIGLRGIDLLEPAEYEIPRRYGLVCTMGYAGGGEIPKALNRVEYHAAIEEGFRTNIPRAAKSGVPNVITFSGNRGGMSDEEGARNTIAGLNRVKKIA